MTDPATVTERDDEWRARLSGLIPDSIGNRRIVIVGCGSVGSFIAAELARAGVSDFVLIDPDTVAWANLTRTVYGHADVGRLKVDALRDHLRSIFPDIKVETYSERLQDLGMRFKDLLAPADLVLGAVDDPQASGRINRFAYSLGVGAIFVGLYRGAQGGEVILSLPEVTPCMACATGGRRHLEAGPAGSVDRPQDYGSNRLVAEVALGSDIHLVCTAAVKLALSLLCFDDSTNPLGRFVEGALKDGMQFVILGMTPNYFVFPKTHAETLGQYAFQSVWMSAESRAECMVCGALDHREPLG